jgi:biotin carboxylase
MIIQVKLIHRDEDGNVAGGVNFYYTRGNNVILYQEWEYRCAGNTYGPVTPDAIGVNLLDYLIDGWLGERENFTYQMDDVNGNYR